MRESDQSIKPASGGQALQRLADRLEAERARRLLALAQESTHLSADVAAQPEVMARAILRRVGIRPLVRVAPLLVGLAILLPTGQAHADPVRATAIAQARVRIIAAAAVLNGSQLHITQAGGEPQSADPVSTRIVTIGQQPCDSGSSSPRQAGSCTVLSFDLP